MRSRGRVTGIDNFGSVAYTEFLNRPHAEGVSDGLKIGHQLIQKSCKVAVVKAGIASNLMAVRPGLQSERLFTYNVRFVAGRG